MTNISESTWEDIPTKYTIALRALFEGRDNNPAHEEFFNSLISALKKKNQCWDRMSVHDSFHLCDEHCFYIN